MTQWGYHLCSATSQDLDWSQVQRGEKKTDREGVEDYDKIMLLPRSFFFVSVCGL